jgi:uroporphyrin-III C-methyltransferase/precorrin-2 dehydrogenase/sirohydrochlorin ferrochelatase
LPDDIDWRSLADPATTTAIYMPARTLAALVAKAMEQGLDPQTPAIAIARATYPDQSAMTGCVGALPERIKVSVLASPILVIIGRVCGKLEIASRSMDKTRVITAS